MNSAKKPGISGLLCFITRLREALSGAVIKTALVYTDLTPILGANFRNDLVQLKATT
jgi:hypothetical protein